MIVTKLGKRYAKSLLDLATELGKVEEVKADILKIQSAIEGSRELRTFLKSPVIKADKKIAVLKEVFGNDISEMMSNFIEIITRKGREGDLEVIADGYMQLYRKSQGVEQALVTTATALSNDQRAAIEAKLQAATGQKIEIKEKVDPSIIGGMRLRVGDREYNGSIAYQLQQLKRQFEDNPYVPEF